MPNINYVIRIEIASSKFEIFKFYISTIPYKLPG